MTSEKYGSFGYMKNRGATTLWEYWNGAKSQNHPMFGSVVKYLFYGVAGIRYSPGFRSIIIRPALYGGLNDLKCTLTRPNVTVNAHYYKQDQTEIYEVSYSGTAEVAVELNGKTISLSSDKPVRLQK